jgi:threonine/homoserine/homoserine lactone efflux protein
MNIKVKAGVIVASIVAVAIAVSGALKLVAPYITLEIASNILMVGSMAVLLYIMYNLILDNLKTSEKYKNKLKSMVDQKSK